MDVEVLVYRLCTAIQSPPTSCRSKKSTRVAAPALRCPRCARCRTPFGEERLRVCPPRTHPRTASLSKPAYLSIKRGIVRRARTLGARPLPLIRRAHAARDPTPLSRVAGRPFRYDENGKAERRTDDRASPVYLCARGGGYEGGVVHARCRGRSLSASVDPYSNDFCVRGMAATGLVRSVRSVMVAQCSSRASA